MSRFELKELSDFTEYTDGGELRDLLTSKDEHRNSLPDVRVSPDGRHIHIILREPKVGLMTYDKYERPQPTQNHKKLELSFLRTVPVVDICYLDHHNNNNNRETAVAAVIYETGKAEFWVFQESKAGWRLLQTSELCDSPQARVMSVCVCSSFITWCEERTPSSESSTGQKLRYCVCRRDFQVEEGAVILTGVKIILHSNPRFTVISSGDYVHLLPDLKSKPPPCVFKFFLTWSPHHDSFTVGAVCKNTPVKKLSAKESDFRELITDCLGYLSALEPPEICSLSPTGCGGLLLLLSTGWLCLLQKDGTIRNVYKLPENGLVQCGTHTNLCMYTNAVALVIGRNLHLIEMSCGRELQKIVMKREGLLYADQTERHAPHLLSETGLFVVEDRKADSSDCSFKTNPPAFGPVEGLHPGALLIEAVFEEACKYYQQRSLSSTQLTVDALKKGGRFQAPIALASILRSFLSTGLKKKKKGAELLQNGGGEFIAGQDKLVASLEGELKALVSLEELKGSLVRGGPKEAEAVCETLMEKEVTRLLSASELDKEALLYLNTIFSVFPLQAWTAAQAALQLHHNGEGSLSSGAPPDVWKTVLGHAQSSAPAASRLFPNGLPRHNHSLKGDHGYKSKPLPSSYPPPVLPVFELLCQSVLRFQPTWLPRFIELAQQQQGAAGLGLGLASSSWSFSSGRGVEGGENNVPLYKRALCVLHGDNPDRDRHPDLEVELLLVGGRPNAILQALRILMGEGQWERVTHVAQQFCKQSPLLNKEIFTALLCEVAQHRDLDPYLDLLWTLCPEDFTVTTILNLVLKSLPSPDTFSGPHITSSSSSPPFADPHSSSQLTIGLLKPLLRKVLQSETKPSQRYVDILQSPSYPPPALPRQPTEQASPVTDAAAPCAATPERQLSAHATIRRSSIALSASPLGFT